MKPLYQGLHMMAHVNMNRFSLALWYRISRLICKDNLFCLVAYRGDVSLNIVNVDICLPKQGKRALL